MQLVHLLTHKICTLRDILFGHQENLIVPRSGGDIKAHGAPKRRGRRRSQDSPPASGRLQKWGRRRDFAWHQGGFRLAYGAMQVSSGRHTWHIRIKRSCNWTLIGIARDHSTSYRSRFVHSTTVYPGLGRRYVQGNASKVQRRPVRMRRVRLPRDARITADQPTVVFHAKF